MQRKHSRVIVALCCIGVAIAELLPAAGLIPSWAGYILLVLIFPWLILALMLWWRSPGGESDLPFIGY